jgi:DNA-binding GntR family transcriptional regulator
MAAPFFDQSDNPVLTDGDLIGNARTWRDRTLLLSDTFEPDEAAAPLPFGSTIYQRVHEQLRADILTGRMAPGSRLKIQDLATRFGLSHMPVREALQKLEGEGLVVVQPKRGASVRQIDAQLLEHVYDVIEALDSLLTAKAAERAGEGAIQRIRAAQQAFEAAAQRGDQLASLACNDAFHKAIHAASGNEEGARLINTPDALIRALRSRLGYGAERLQDIAKDHAAIAAAIAARDAEGARRLAIAHVRTARVDLIKRLAMQQEAMRAAPGHLRAAGG